ncbi:hypothetical protein [Rhizobium sp. SL86]|jgi:cytochrome c-type biogenesis protein CcmH/NrfF|uniref:hypothetical protein n=1 Tax=Rhizobium sp. SL86 TaxID=2995148 RepID=UPI00227300DF|nr:hypothetical protein [Rhizobium sp. SL86]MCY1665978.1 hypothetical protein [Rhizobium sp. SL86]
MIDNLWFVAVAIGPVLLGAAFIYAMMRRRRLTRPEELRQDAAIQDLYEKPSRRT